MSTNLLTLLLSKVKAGSAKAPRRWGSPRTDTGQDPPQGYPQVPAPGATVRDARWRRPPSPGPMGFAEAENTCCPPCCIDAHPTSFFLRLLKQSIDILDIMSFCLEIILYLFFFFLHFYNKKLRDVTDKWGKYQSAWHSLRGHGVLLTSRLFNPHKTEALCDPFPASPAPLRARETEACSGCGCNCTWHRCLSWRACVCLKPARLGVFTSFPIIAPCRRKTKQN